MAMRCLFNPTFRAASELVSVSISANAAIARTLNVSAYLKQLDRFIQTEVSPARVNTITVVGARVRILL